MLECSNLSSVGLKGCLIGKVAESCFQATGIAEIKIPPSVTEIAQGAFKQCQNLVSIAFDDGSHLDKIWYGIVSGCPKLKTFEIPSSVSQIDPGSFSGAIGLDGFIIKGNPKYEERNGVLYEKKGPVLHSFPGGRANGSVESDAVGIASMAFRDCSNLVNITFGDGSLIKAVGSFTFSGCSKLQSLELPGSIERIEESGFSGCASLETVIFGADSKLEVISSSTFAGCNKLRSIEFEGESELKRIGRKSFFECETLTAFLIPSGVKDIEESAFEGCIKLSSIGLSKVINIGSRSFMGCKQLREVTLGPLEKLGDLSFAKCSNLKMIKICDPSNAAVGTACFEECGANGVYVPSAYEEKTLGGLAIIRILDIECNIPTFKFSAGVKENAQNVFPEFVILLSNSEE